MDKYDIFISYRRVDGADFARQMQLALSNLEYKVFLDFDELKDGVFNKRIEQAIKNSSIFLFVLSPRSLERCADKNDWVRLEIECALLSNCHIVPVNPNALFDKDITRMSELPETIKEGLGLHQISTIMTNDLFQCTFNEFVNRRIRIHIENTKKDFNEELHSNDSEVHFETNLPCSIYRYGILIATIKPKDDNTIYLKKGIHKLNFISIENEVDKFELLYNNTEKDSDFVAIDLNKIKQKRIQKEKKQEIILRKQKEEQKKQEQQEKEKLRREQEEKEISEEYSEKVLQRIRDNQCCIFSKRKNIFSSHKYGFINRDNNTIICNAIYDEVHPFSEGLAAIRQDGRWGFIDKNGNVVISCKYERVGSFSDGLAWVQCSAEILKFIKFINKNGYTVIKDLIVDSCFDVESFSEGLAAIRQDGRWGFIDKNGNVVISCKYERVHSFSERRAAIRQDGRWGFIDKDGDEVISCEYDEVGRFSQGLAPVEYSRRWGYINRYGEICLDFNYDDAKSFSEGLAPVNKNGKWGYINNEGKMVLDFKFDMAFEFEHSRATVRIGNKQFDINRKGEKIRGTTVNIDHWF